MEHSRWDCFDIVCLFWGRTLGVACWRMGTQGGTALGTDVGCRLLPSRSAQGNGGVVGLILVGCGLLPSRSAQHP